jgi:competence protein ComGC
MITIKTREQVAKEYGKHVTVKMLNAHIEKYELPIKANTSLFPKQQKQIYETLGYPSCVDRKLYEDV